MYSPPLAAVLAAFSASDVLSAATAAGRAAISAISAANARRRSSSRANCAVAPSCRLRHDVSSPSSASRRRRRAGGAGGGGLSCQGGGSCGGLVAIAAQCDKPIALPQLLRRAGGAGIHAGEAVPAPQMPVAIDEVLSGAERWLEPPPRLNIFD